MKNEIKYETAYYLVLAAKNLKELGEDKEFIEVLLNKAEKLKNEIVVNQKEIDKIAEYKRKI